MTFHILEHTLAGNLAPAGTADFAWPAGLGPGDFVFGADHRMTDGMNDWGSPRFFAVAFDAVKAQVTWNGAHTIPAGTKLRLQLQVAGQDDGEAYRLGVQVPGLQPAHLTLINLGSPAAADPDGVCASQTITGAQDALINGALAANGVATFPEPRGLQAVSDNVGDTTQTLTVTGTDVDGLLLVEDISLNGTTAVEGKKAFKTVTRVAVSAALTGNLTVGTSNVLGLPSYLAGAGLVLKELEDGSTATAGTIATGDITTSSSTSGDVRGTYTPNSAPDGAKGFALLAALPDPFSPGVAQYAG